MKRRDFLKNALTASFGAAGAVALGAAPALADSSRRSEEIQEQIGLDRRTAQGLRQKGFDEAVRYFRQRLAPIGRRYSPRDPRPIDDAARQAAEWLFSREVGAAIDSGRPVPQRRVIIVIRFRRITIIIIIY